MVQYHTFWIRNKHRVEERLQFVDRGIEGKVWSKVPSETVMTQSLYHSFSLQGPLCFLRCTVSDQVPTHADMQNTSSLSPVQCEAWGMRLERTQIKADCTRHCTRCFSQRWGSLLKIAWKSGCRMYYYRETKIRENKHQC